MDQNLYGGGQYPQGGYPAATNVKSATTAGLLGLFLGGVGAHNWYLGEKTKGIIHCCLFGSGILVTIIGSVVLPSVLSWTALLTWGAILSILGVVSWLLMIGNGIWALVEAIQILVGGDAKLAQRGYAVAMPAAPQYPPQGYAQPGPQGQPQQPYPYPPQQGYAQPPQGYPQQPQGEQRPEEGHHES